MSFASDTRAEIARDMPQSLCCAKSALVCALLLTGGISYRGRDRYSVSVTTQDASAARLYYRILREHYSVNCEIRTIRASAFGGRVQYQLAIRDEDCLPLLRALNLTDDTALFGIRTTPSPDTLAFSCCKKSFLRSAFLLCGMLANPEKSYQMEFPCPTEEIAGIIEGILTYFEIHAKITCRKVKSVVYLKKSETIADALRLLGASSATMRYENVLIGKEFGNRVNRQINCDDSNIDRVMKAAEAQIEDIRYIDSELGLEKLPKTLQEYAHVRAENPSVSLTVLGELLDPPLGKSGVNARARRISDIADRLRSGEEVHI